jgi:hypothetical protein
VAAEATGLTFVSKQGATTMFNKTDTHMLHLVSDYQIGCYADRMAKRQEAKKKAKCGTPATKQQR